MKCATWTPITVTMQMCCQWIRTLKIVCSRADRTLKQSSGKSTKMRNCCTRTANIQLTWSSVWPANFTWHAQQQTMQLTYGSWTRKNQCIPWLGVTRKAVGFCQQLQLETAICSVQAATTDKWLSMDLTERRRSLACRGGLNNWMDVWMLWLSVIIGIWTC